MKGLGIADNSTVLGVCALEGGVQCWLVYCVCGGGGGAVLGLCALFRGSILLYAPIQIKLNQKCFISKFLSQK